MHGGLFMHDIREDLFPLVLPSSFQELVTVHKMVVSRPRSCLDNLRGRPIWLLDSPWADPEARSLRHKYDT